MPEFGMMDPGPPLWSGLGTGDIQDPSLSHLDQSDADYQHRHSRGLMSAPQDFYSNRTYDYNIAVHNPIQHSIQPAEPNLSPLETFSGFQPESQEPLKQPKAEPLCSGCLPSTAGGDHVCGFQSAYTTAFTGESGSWETFRGQGWAHGCPGPSEPLQDTQWQVPYDGLTTPYLSSASSVCSRETPSAATRYTSPSHDHSVPIFGVPEQPSQIDLRETAASDEHLPCTTSTQMTSPPVWISRRANDTVTDQATSQHRSYPEPMLLSPPGSVRPKKQVTKGKSNGDDSKKIVDASANTKVKPDNEVQQRDETQKYKNALSRRKRPLTEDSRQSAASTRALGACIRCRMQRLQCKGNPSSCDEPCLTCIKVDVKSPKLMHTMPCTRAKLTEVKISLPLDLGITQRWRSLSAIDINDWSSEKTTDVLLMTRRLCSEPLVLGVRRFNPQMNDQVHYYWRDDEEGQIRTTELKPYALANISEAGKHLEEYVVANAIKSWREQIQRADIPPLVSEHYDHALRHYYQLDDHAPERKLLFNLFKLHFSLRLSMNPSWIYRHDYKTSKCLEISPIKEKNHPLFTRIPTPRMIVAQLHSLNCLRNVEPLSKEIMLSLDKLYSKKVPKSFFTVYVVTFLLLHEHAAIYEHQRLGRSEFSGTENETRVHEAFARSKPTLINNTDIILLHWEYYKRAPSSIILADDFYGDSVNKGFFCDITDDQSTLYRKTRSAMINLIAEGHQIDPNAYGTSFYWVSQMFRDDWRPEGRLSSSRNTKQTPGSRPSKVQRSNTCREVAQGGRKTKST